MLARHCASRGSITAPPLSDLNVGSPIYSRNSLTKLCSGLRVNNPVAIAKLFEQFYSLVKLMPSFDLVPDLREQPPRQLLSILAQVVSLMLQLSQSQHS